MASDTDLAFTTDVFVIGSEGAGASAAIEAAKTGIDVLVATKGGDVGRSGSTVNIDGDMLSQARKDQGLSLAELSRKVGVSPRTIQMYEGGMSASVEVACAIEDILNVIKTVAQIAAAPKDE